MTGVMSMPIPSPSVYGMIGLSGVGCPRTILAPPSGTVIRDSVLMLSPARSGVLCRAEATAPGDRGRRHATRLPFAGMDTIDTRTELQLAQRIADVLFEGFERHYTRFRATSAKAKQRFEDAAWSEAQQAVRERIRFYDDRVRECVERLRAELAEEDVDDAIWQQAKLLYIGMLVDYKRPELAETFFNSVITRMLGTIYAHNDFIFVRAAISTEYIGSDPPTWRSYYPNELGLRKTMEQVFRDFGWERPFADLERDVGSVLGA